MCEMSGKAKWLLNFHLSKQTLSVTMFNRILETAKHLQVHLIYISDKVTEAEIIWSITSLINHHSLRSAGSIASLFKIMFPDSTIASKLQVGATKMSYLISYGLAPYFRKLIYSKLLKCQFYEVSFDENFNKDAKKWQMDIVIKFYDEEQLRNCHPLL